MLPLIAGANLVFALSPRLDRQEMASPGQAVRPPPAKAGAYPMAHPLTNLRPYDTLQSQLRGQPGIAVEPVVLGTAEDERDANQ